MGGCAYSIINIFGRTEFTDTAKLLCITVFLSYIILNVITSVYEKHFKYGNLVHSIVIGFNNREIETKCFYDTGNNLKDPVTKTPVIIINPDTAQQLLPENFYKKFLITKDVVALYISFFDKLNLKLIPYKTITEKGFIIGFVPTKVTIDGNNTKAIIGISSSTISKDKSYNAIVNPHTI